MGNTVSVDYYLLSIAIGLINNTKLTSMHCNIEKFKHEIMPHIMYICFTCNSLKLFNTLKILFN